MSRKRAILWDNDGVLVDTEPVFFEACRRVLKQCGVEATWEMFEEISLKQGESLLPLSGLEGTALEALFAERDVVYGELLETEQILVDGVGDVLRSLAGTCAMGIVTASQRVHFDVIHRRSGLLGHFDFVLTREDYAKSKPHPDGYLLGIERSGVPADECIAVEDSPRGVEAARRAGIDCVLLGAGEGDAGSGAAVAAVSPQTRRAASLADLGEILRGLAG